MPYLFRVEVFQITLATLNIFQEFRVPLEVEEYRRSREVKQALEVGRGGQVEAEGLQLGVGLDSQRRILADTESPILNLKFSSARSLWEL